MKKIIFSFLIVSVLFILNGCTKTIGMANPWEEFNMDLVAASKRAGFTFPLELKDFKTRAMKGMIEVEFPLDKERTLILRKSDKSDNDDISGVYTNYPINKDSELKNGVPIKIRADKDKIYVMNISAYTGYYSAYCEKGMTKDELEFIYELLRKTEDKPIPDEAFE